MFVIIRSATKRKMVLGLRIMVTLVVLGLVVSHLYNIYYHSTLSQAGWLKEDKPSGNPMKVLGTEEKNGKQVFPNGNSGNPMRVEKTEQKAGMPQKGNVLDEFVVKLQDFYRGDR